MCDDIVYLVLAVPSEAVSYSFPQRIWKPWDPLTCNILQDDVPSWLIWCGCRWWIRWVCQVVKEGDAAILVRRGRSANAAPALWFPIYMPRVFTWQLGAATSPQSMCMRQARPCQLHLSAIDCPGLSIHLQTCYSSYSSLFEETIVSQANEHQFKKNQTLNQCFMLPISSSAPLPI